MAAARTAYRSLEIEPYNSCMSDLLRTLWSALGETDDAPLERVQTGGEPGLSSMLAVDELLRSAVAVASLSAALHSPDSGQVRLDSARLRTAVVNSGVLRIDGAEPSIWADFSGFWRCRDGWVRTHANYPHHRTRLLRALGLAEDATKEQVADVLTDRSATEIEDTVVGAGGIAARVRTQEEWHAEAQASALAAQRLVEYASLDDKAPLRSDRGRTWTSDGNPEAPLAGLRVLDFTRVIAGPVATRTLALFGADVVRIDDPHLPEPLWQHFDTGAGKRSALLDLRSVEGRQRLSELVRTADVVVTGYRPGALARWGLSPQELARERPGLVLAQISAWSDVGPWGSRRGFDSIVQAATGIAWLESGDGERPGALPVQALDHSAGYVLAAAVMSTLRRGVPSSGVHLKVALARIAHELLQAGQRSRSEDTVPRAFPTAGEFVVDGHSVRIAQPAPAFDRGPVQWPAPPSVWGSDEPRWRSL